MSKAKHTPGPHTLSPNGKYIDSPKGWIAEIVAWPKSSAGVKQGSEEFKANGYLFVRAWSMLALLEKALSLTETEAIRREYACVRDAGEDYDDGDPYWSEMRDLANEISAEVDRAKGKGVSDG